MECNSQQPTANVNHIVPEIILGCPVDLSSMPVDFGVRELSRAVSTNMGVAATNYIILNRNGPILDNSNTRGVEFWSQFRGIRDVHAINARIDSMEIKKEDILSLIRSLNPNKATGSDEISGQMLQICDESVVLPLFITFRNILDSCLP